MKRSSLPQLLAAPAIAGLLLLSPVGSAQANNHEWLKAAAPGALGGFLAGGLITYLIANVPRKDISRLEQYILKLQLSVEKLDTNTRTEINNLDKNLQDKIACKILNSTSEIKGYISNYESKININK